MTEARFSYLFDQYIADAITDAESKEFALEVVAGKNDEVLDRLLDKLLTTTTDERNISDERAEEIIRKVVRRQETGVRRMLPLYRWIAVAAMIVLVVGVWYLNRESTVESREKEVVQIQDVPAPVSTKATITLANGKVIVPNIINGEVEKISRSARDDNSFELLSNPRGSKIVSIELSDGTKVWLNAESTLKYPVAFNRRERRVTVSGEAYFEVVKNNSKFIVESKGVETEVLGTHFNINSYEDPIVTLLEGSVQVHSALSAVKLRPGQGAVNGELFEADTESTLAWKNGLFAFKNASIETIMSAASRWYDVDVNYEGSIPDVQFSGKIGRELTLKQFLSILDETRIHYTIEGKRLTIVQ